MNISKWLDERVSNSPRDHPKSFYWIENNGDGTGDVYLIPCYRSTDRIYGYEMDIYCIKGVELYEGIEDDIRYRYYAWLSSAAKIRTSCVETQREK